MTLSHRLIIAAFVFLALVLMALGDTIVVTAYCPCAKCCGRWARVPDHKRTFADGTRFNRAAKVCAIDTHAFHFGDTFEIPGVGTYAAHDTGNKVKGSHIDLLFRNHKEALAFGRRIYELEITNNSYARKNQ